MLFLWLQEERRARNAQYERERRNETAAAMSLLIEAADCEPNVRYYTMFYLVTFAFHDIQNNALFYLSTDINCWTSRDGHQSHTERVCRLYRRARTRKREPGGSKYESIVFKLLFFACLSLKPFIYNVLFYYSRLSTGSSRLGRFGHRSVEQWRYGKFQLHFGSFSLLYFMRDLFTYVMLFCYREQNGSVRRMRRPNKTTRSGRKPSPRRARQTPVLGWEDRADLHPRPRRLRPRSRTRLACKTTAKKPL